MSIDIDTFNPLDPGFIQSPYEALKEIREMTPVFHIKPLNMYLVTSYELVKTVMKNPARFSSMFERRNSTSEEAIRIINEEGYGRDLPALQNNDPPAHALLRQLVNKAFQPKRIRQIEGYIDGISCDLIADIVRGGDTTEALDSFAVPIPMITIAEQIGMSREGYRTFKEWSDAWMIGVGSPAPDEELIAAARLVVKLQRYLVERIEERRVKPREDILTDLMSARTEDGGELTIPQILSIVEQLMVAGNETTSGAIGMGLHVLARNQELQAQLRAAPDLIPEFVEELLRTESPVQSMLRRTTEDAELAGVHLPKGSVVMAHFGAANRDPERFPDPDAFDIGRPGKGAHLAFGSGIHHCVGSELARVEMRSAFRTFLAHFSGFELFEPEVTYRTSFAFRSLAALPLRLKAA